MRPAKFVAAALLSLLALAPKVFAHAFPDHAQPPVGSTVTTAPSEVKIWFSEKLEPSFSKLDVHDAAGAQVDRGGGAVDPWDPTMLRVALKPLPPGTYKVHWHAVSADTHTTDGTFTFTVK